MFDAKSSQKTDWGELLELHSGLLIHLVQNELLQKENESMLSYFEQENVIQLWNDVLQTRFEIVENRIKALEGKLIKIHARQCHIKEISSLEMSSFLDKHHLQGSVKAKIRYGMWKNDELQAVALFAPPRAMTYDGKTDYFSGELIRFCSKMDVRINGALDKFLKHYEKIHRPNDVMTYADKDWSNAKSFVNLGFNKISTTTPMAFLLDKEKSRLLCKNPLPLQKYYWNSGSIKLIRYVEQ